jgi:glycosyltransferase involved in cell wall biosynthesis
MLTHVSPVVLTVGLPVFNGVGDLESAIRSVLWQTWRGSLEILVVDDGSTDETVALVQQLTCEYPCIRLVRHDKNHGRPFARNTILREARGEYLAWLDADDEWYPDKLQKQFDLLLKHEKDDTRPTICLCPFDWLWTKSQSRKHNLQDVRGDQLRGFLNGRIGAYLWTMLGKTEHFRAVGDFDEQLPRLQDMDFLIRYCARGGHLICTEPNQPLCVYHKDDSDRPGRVIASSLRRIWEKHLPLYQQYGSSFVSGSRRKHYMLAARHAAKNEGASLAARYRLQAFIATPGLLLKAPRRAIMELLGYNTDGPPKSRPFESIRRTSAAVPTYLSGRKNNDNASVDLFVTCTKVHAEWLNTVFERLHNAYAAEGIRVPTWSGAFMEMVQNEGIAHGGLSQENLSAEDHFAIRKTLISNSGGQSMLMNLGAATDLYTTKQQGTLSAAVSAVENLKRLIAALKTSPYASRINLHLIAPDSESIIWARYFDGLVTMPAHGPDKSVDDWFSAQASNDRRGLTHEELSPLTEVEGLAGMHAYILSEGAKGGDLLDKIFSNIGLSTAVELEADEIDHPLVPGRNRHIIHLLRRLPARSPFYSSQRLDRIFSSLISMPADEKHVLLEQPLAQQFDQALGFKPYAQRLPNFSIHQLGEPSAHARLRASELAMPKIAEPVDTLFYEKLWLHMLMH